MGMAMPKAVYSQSGLKQMEEQQLFSEQEASQILDRAVRLQELGSPTYTPGVTFDELKRIASEVGISEDILRQAIHQPKDNSRPHFFALAETFERVFEGELDRDRMDEVVEALREHVRVNGAPLGKSLQLQLNKGVVFGRAELGSRNGRTRLKFTQVPFVAYFAGLHGPLILGVVAGANMMAQGLTAPGLAVLLGVPLLGLAAFAKMAVIGRRKAREMFEAVSRDIQGILAQTRKPDGDA